LQDLTLVDIKSYIFYVSLFLTFVNIKTLQLADALVIILVTIVTVVGVKVFYAFSTTKIIAVSKGYKVEGKAQKTAGGFLVGLGAYLFIKA